MTNQSRLVELVSAQTSAELTPEEEVTLQIDAADPDNGPKTLQVLWQIDNETAQQAVFNPNTGFNEATMRLGDRHAGRATISAMASDGESTMTDVSLVTVLTDPLETPTEDNLAAHIFDLDVVYDATLHNGKWLVGVSIGVQDGAGNLLSAANAMGQWSGDDAETGCDTNSNGRRTVYFLAHQSTGKLSFMITDIDHQEAT